MENFNLKIEKITVLILQDGTDKVSIHTNLPSPYISAYDPSQQPLILDFNVTKGNGIEYVRNVFGIEPEVIDTQNPSKNFRFNKTT